MVMITSTPDRDTLSRLDRRPLSFGDASWEADTSTTAVPDAATERWSGGFGDAYDGSPYGRYGDAALPAPPPPEPSRNERIADYWRLYSGSPSAIMSGMTAVGVSVAELAAATGQSQDAVGRYLQAGGASDGFGGWFDPAIAAAAAAAAAAAERRDLIAAYWAANKNDPIEVLKVMGTTGVSVAELAQATGQTVDQVNACLYPALVGPMPPATDIGTQLPTGVMAGAGTTVTTSVVLAPAAAIPVDPMTINAASFHTQVDALLARDPTTQTSIWSNPDGAGPVLSLAAGQSWQPSGGGAGGSGITRYDPHSLDQAYVPNLVELDAGSRDIGGGVDPTQLFASLGMQLGRDLIDLELGARGYDVGDAGHVDGVPVSEAARAAAYARALARGEFDASLPLYVVTGDASDLLGQPDSRMFLSVGYQERNGQMVPVGQALNYRKSAGAENMAGVMAFASFVTMGMTGAFSGAAAAGEAAAGAGFNAAVDSQLANLAIEAGGGSALAGYSGAAFSAAVPTTTTASGLAGLSNQVGTALGFTGETAATAGNFVIKVGVQTVANGGDLKGAIVGAVGGVIGGFAGDALQSLHVPTTLAGVLGGAVGSYAIGQDPLQAALSGAVGAGVNGLTSQIDGFNNLPSVVQNTLTSAASSIVLGQDLTSGLISSGLYAGLDAVSQGGDTKIDGGALTTGNLARLDRVTGETGDNTVTVSDGNRLGTYDGGMVFTLGALDEATGIWATTIESGTGDAYDSLQITEPGDGADAPAADGSGNSMGDSPTVPTGRGGQPQESLDQVRVQTTRVLARGDQTDYRGNEPVDTGVVWRADVAARTEATIGYTAPSDRNGFDAQSDAYIDGRHTITIGQGQGVLLAIDAGGLSHIEQRAAYGQLVRTGQLTAADFDARGTPIVQAGRQFYLDSNDFTAADAYLGGRLIGAESDNRAAIATAEAAANRERWDALQTGAWTGRTNQVAAIDSGTSAGLAYYDPMTGLDQQFGGAGGGEGSFRDSSLLGATGGVAASFGSMALGAARIGGNAIMQVGDVLTGGYNHNHPLMQQVWAEQRAFGAGVFNALTNPLLTTTDIIEGVVNRYDYALAQGNDFDRSYELGALFNDIGQGAIGAGAALRGVVRFGTTGLEFVGENAFAGPLAGGQRAQFGAINIGEDAALPFSRLSQPGGLEATEGNQVLRLNGRLSNPTHPLERHGPDVTDQYVYDRAANELANVNRTGLRTAFNDRTQMESAIAETIRQNQVEIDAWIASGPRPGVAKPFEANPGMGNLGRGFEVTTPGGSVIPITRPMTNVNLVLMPDGNGGYFILTAHPF